jgi:hypothetical protein
MESLDGIPEELHENYEKTDDGKFQLTLLKGLVSEGDQDTYDALRGAIEKERTDKRTETQKRRDLETAIETLGGIDAIKELKTQQEDAARSNLEKKGEYDTLLNQVKEEHVRELDKERGKNKTLTARLDREIRGRQVMEAIAKHDGNPNLLQPILMQATRLAGQDDDNGELRVEIFKDDIMLVDGEGRSLTVEGYVERLRADEAYAGAFKGTGHSGGGGSGDTKPAGGGGGGGDGGGIPPELANLTRGAMTPRQKVDIQNALTDKHGGDREKALNEFLQIPM